MSRKYYIQFNCMMPAKIDAVIIAENEDELIRKMEERDIGEFHFKTTHQFREIHNIIIKEVEE